MSQSRLAAMAILALSTVTAAGFAYYQYQRAEMLTVALAESKSVTIPEMRTGPMDDTPADLPAPDEETEGQATGETDATTDESAETDRSRRANRGNMAARFQEMMGDPQYVQAFQLQQRARLDGRYAALFAQLNLPPATLTKLQDLLAEKQNTARDVFMAAREEGFDGREDRDQLRALVETTQAEIDADIIATIGEQNYQSLQDYEQTGRQRALVNQFDNRLSYKSTPLNSVQSQALTAILAETAADNQGRGGRRNPSSVFGGGGGGVQITDATINRAQVVLSPSQLDALKDMQSEQQAGQLLNNAMREGTAPGRSQGGGGARGPGGGG